MNRTLIAAVLVALMTPAAAGCLQLPNEAGADGSSDDGSGAAAGDGRLTAEESQTESVGLEPGVPPAYVARRTITVAGTVSLDAVPVTLANVNGPVTVQRGPAGSWSVVAELRGEGVTESDARADRDGITFTWFIERDGRYHIDARVEYDDGEGRRSSTIVLTVPGELVLDLRASTVNGRVTVDDGPVSSLNAHTTNGAVTVTAHGVRSAAIGSTNGPTKATLTPPANDATGRYHANAVNGDVTLAVPEGRAFGYEARAHTVNGVASITLTDGDAQQTGGFGSSGAQFKTDAFTSRSSRAAIIVGATNGDATVEPA